MEVNGDQSCKIWACLLGNYNPNKNRLFKFLVKFEIGSFLI